LKFFSDEVIKIGADTTQEEIAAICSRPALACRCSYGRAGKVRQRMLHRSEPGDNRSDFFLGGVRADLDDLVG